MLFTFLGTGTSMGIPKIGCRCATCTSQDPRNKRLRASALVEVKGLKLLIDVGPDFRAQALTAQLDHLDAVLLTHSHFDHIGGIDDLRPLTDLNSMPIYGNPRTLADLRERFSYAFMANASEGSTRPYLDLIPVTAPFMLGDVKIIPFTVQHGTWTITGYRIGKLGYITDASELPPLSRILLQGLDVLVLNALRLAPHPTHFNFAEAQAVIANLQPQRAFLIHMNHALEHETANAQLPPNVTLAYDGLTLEIDDE